MGVAGHLGEVAEASAADLAEEVEAEVAVAAVEIQSYRRRVR